MEGKANKKIIPREITLTTRDLSKIYWVCLNCQREYANHILEQLKFVCACGQKNDFLPFSVKECENEKCKENDHFHQIALQSKACDICGEKNFIYNHQFHSQELHPSMKENSPWMGPQEYKFSNTAPNEKKNQDSLSCTTTILNNNFQSIQYGEEQYISIKRIIKEGKGFIPDKIFEDLLQNYALDEPLFKIVFNSQENIYEFFSVFKGCASKLNARFEKIKTHEFIANQAVKLEENVLTQIETGFFKIHLWVY